MLEAQEAAQQIYQEAPEVVTEILEEKSSEAAELKRQIKEKIRNLKKYSKDEEDYDFWREMIVGPMAETLQGLRQAIYKMEVLTGKKKLPKDHVTPQQIEMAKAFPFKNLIEINKGGFARCPFHGTDKTPSFFTRKNYGHCFSCGWSGDTIRFVRQLHKLSFREAIDYLT